MYQLGLLDQIRVLEANLSEKPQGNLPMQSVWAEHLLAAVEEFEREFGPVPVRFPWGGVEPAPYWVWE